MATEPRNDTRSRNWCFTDFDNIDFNHVWEQDQDVGKAHDIRYLCVGQEECPTTGREHQQGWVQFTTPRRMGGVKRILENDRLSVRPCNGNERQNDVYCKKDGDYESWGEFTVQGERKDLNEIKDMLETGATLYAVANANFKQYCQYHRAFEKYRALKQQSTTPKWRDVNVTLIMGPTGTNKTRFANQMSDFKIQGSQLKWWDGYEGEKNILIDEYSNEVKITELLALLDGYKLRLPIKGGHTWAAWTNVYITSNLKALHPKASDAHREALQRRVKKTWNLWDDEEREEWEEMLDTVD